MSDIRKITIQILLDAFDQNYFSEGKTPFLCELASDGISGKIKPSLGFANTRPAIFAGVPPEKSDLFTMFYYSPESSPFRCIRLPRMIGNFPVLGRAVRYAIGKYVRLTTTNSAVKHYATAASIPLNLLRYFDFSEKELAYEENYLGSGIRTIFDILRLKKKEWVYIGWPLYGNDDSKLDFFKKNVAENEFDFIYLHLSKLDHRGHEYGPRSKQVDNSVRELDSELKEIYQLLRAKYNEINLIVFSDHGMVEVKKTVNISAEIKRGGLILEKNYVMFLDSTMARIWPRNRKAKSTLREILSRLRDGRILDEQDYRDNRIRFPHNKYGELIFLANPGVLISPNFFQGSCPVKGMHGYDPLHPYMQSHHGIVVVHSPKIREVGKIDAASLVDICPTTLMLMDLPTPRTCYGKILALWSLLQ